MDAYQTEYLFILHKYNEAYYRWVFCPDAERDEAKRLLDIWRHKWFNH